MGTLGRKLARLPLSPLLPSSAAPPAAHPFLTRFYGSCTCIPEAYTSVVYEYHSGPNLGDRLDDRRLPAHVLADITYSLVSVVSFCVSKKIMLAPDLTPATL